MQGPTRYIHDSPSHRTPYVGGEPINMRLLADEEGFDYTYLSHIFARRKMPSTKFGERLAEALGMNWSDLYTILSEKNNP